LALLMAATGRTAVSNTDILDFLRSPTGLLYAALLGVTVQLAALLEHAGVMAVVALEGSGRPIARVQTRAAVAASIYRMLRLGAVKLAALVVVFTPLLVLAGLTYLALLSRHDINYYLADRPPAFYLAAGVGGLLLLGGLVLGAVLYVRWVFALPILLFAEPRWARPTFGASARRV